MLTHSHDASQLRILLVGGAQRRRCRAAAHHAAIAPLGSLCLQRLVGFQSFPQLLFEHLEPSGRRVECLWWVGTGAEHAARVRLCKPRVVCRANWLSSGQLVDEWSVDQAVWRSLICKPHPGYPGSHARQAEGATWGAATRSPLQAITFPPVSTGSSEGFNRRPTHEPLHPLSSTQPHKPGACIPGAATRKPHPQSTPPITPKQPPASHTHNHTPGTAPACRGWTGSAPCPAHTPALSPPSAGQRRTGRRHSPSSPHAAGTAAPARCKGWRERHR